MAVLILLVLGLASLVVGLILQSSGWLIASLAASVLAGTAMIRLRHTLGDQSAVRPDAQPTADQPPGPDVEVWVVDGRPLYHRQACELITTGALADEAEPIALDQALEDGFLPCSLCQPVTAGSAPS